MKASPKFLRYLNRGEDAIEVIPCVFVGICHEFMEPAKRGVGVSLLEKMSDKPRRCAITMTSAEARRLAQSLIKYADASDNPKHNLCESDVLQETP